MEEDRSQWKDWGKASAEEILADLDKICGISRGTARIPHMTVTLKNGVTMSGPGSVTFTDEPATKTGSAKAGVSGAKLVPCSASQHHGFHPENEVCGYCPATHVKPALGFVDPWAHWSNYEEDQIERYLDMYGFRWLRTWTKTQKVSQLKRQSWLADRPSWVDPSTCPYPEP